MSTRATEQQLTMKLTSATEILFQHFYAIRFASVILAVTLAGPVSAEKSAETIEPKKFESLTTTKSRTYRSVTVREVTPSGIKIFHESGSATIHYEDLPADIQKELGGFDRDAAVKHREETDALANAQERELEEALIRQGGKPPASAPPGEENIENPPEKPALDNRTPVKKDRGIVTARIVGKRPGLKRIEFTASTNCPARLEIHNAVGADPLTNDGILSIDIEPNLKFTKEIWVHNNYSCQLFSKKGDLLDTEKAGRKTGLDRENAPTLR